MLSSVKVDRQKLLNIVQENREQHAIIAAEAKRGYIDKAKRVFHEKLEKANNGIVDLRLDLQEPQDYTKEYDTALEMLKWETQQVIELSSSNFKAFVMDDWSWKNNFLLTNSNYSLTASGLYYN